MNKKSKKLETIKCVLRVSRELGWLVIRSLEFHPVVESLTNRQGLVLIPINIMFRSGSVCKRIAQYCLELTGNKKVFHHVAVML